MAEFVLDYSGAEVNEAVEVTKNLATIATTGDAKDLTQTTGDVLVLYCGTALELI